MGWVFSSGGGGQENRYIMGNCQERSGLDNLHIWEGAWQKKGWYPNEHYDDGKKGIAFEYKTWPSTFSAFAILLLLENLWG